jgi:hypothetical protein
MPDNDEAHSTPAENISVVRAFADELPDMCPPPGATSANGIFYATHRTAPPGQFDFRTAAARNVFKGGDECKRRGNSVVASVDDARHLCRAYPDSYAYVSEGELNATHGMIVKDETNRLPSHHTLWRFAGVTMHSIFTKVL